MNTKKDSVLKKWIEHARYDLETARAMLRTGRFLYVAFMCQQTVEKILKAMVAQKGKEILPVHNLVRLAEMAEIYFSLSTEQQDFLADLSPFVIKARYGTYKKRLSEIIDKRKSTKILLQTEEIFKCLLKMMK
ncbi:MAG: HEPN domain-containing protein [Elusimicrobiota bacterium]